MNLLKCFVFGFALLTATASFAQKLGVKGGLNLSDMVVKDDYGGRADSKMNPGFHLGAIVQWPIAEMFSFDTGLLFSMKGFKTSEEETFMNEYMTEIDVKYETRTNLFYLTVPLTARGTYNLGGSVIYVLFGPYVAMGVSGKVSFEYTHNEETEKGENDIRWGTDGKQDDFKRLDYGLTLGTGVEINVIQVGISYGWGLANISSYTADGNIVRNRVFDLSVGYSFGEN